MKEQFIPIVIQRPFYYFEYKNDMFSLLNSKISEITQNQNDLAMDYCDGCTFRQMLRSYKLKNQSLESFILKRINMKTTTQYSQQNLEISKNSKNKQIIQYSELLSDKTQFLIVFSQNARDLQSILEIKNYYNKFQLFLSNHIKHTYKILKLPQSQIQRNIIRLNLSCTSNFLIENKTIKQFDALKLFNFFRKLVHKNIQIISYQEDIIINTYKILFILAFHQIFELFNQLDFGKKWISLALMTNQTVGQTYLEILISVNQSDKFLRMWQENYVLRHIESVLFSEVCPNETFRLRILDLEDAIPYKINHKKKEEFINYQLSSQTDRFDIFN